MRRLEVLVCSGTACLSSGSEAVKRALLEAISAHGIADEVRIVETGCMGPCELGPVMLVYPEGTFYVKVKPEDVEEIVVEHFLKGRPVRRLLWAQGAPAPKEPPFFARQKKVVLSNCGAIDPEEIEEYIAAGGYEALGKALTEMSPDEVIEEIKRSGLRGRGGAGFPTGVKWEAVRRAPGQEKYVICNADEGEPGTFKDRLILEGDPHKLIEGMIIAGYAVGARKGYVYIRGEYQLSIARMQKAISQAREYGLLGDDILGSGFSFDLEVRPGAGAYVCGEETSLIESLEGKRGWPRIRPPYPVTCGLWGKPTVVNNVETLANVPEILRQGADWYRTLGTPTCPGTKVYTLLGHVRYPGLVEVEMGTPLRTLVYELGGGVPEGRTLKAVLVGGAAGAFLSPQDLDVRMDFDSLREMAAALGSGAVLVMDESACIVDMLASVLRFFRHESCGQCTPCRAGTDALVRLIEAVRRGEGDGRTLGLMTEIVETMRLASLCPLGQSVALPVTTALTHFRDEFEAHLAGEPCPRCHKLEGALR